MKGSIRKKGKKYYYRFYIETPTGKKKQIEKAGTASKSETEKLMREAIREYEVRRITPSGSNITLGALLDMWSEEVLSVSPLSNGTIDNYTQAIKRIRKCSIAEQRLKNITADKLQGYLDMLLYGGADDNGTSYSGYSTEYLRSFFAVLRHAFKWAVFPKGFITFDPMQYVKLHRKSVRYDIFSEDPQKTSDVPTISRSQFDEVVKTLKSMGSAAVLPIQIAYYTGLRIGEACSLVWEDINLEEQYMIVRRSARRNTSRKKLELGPAKRNKIRTVDFGNDLSTILYEAKAAQKKDIDDGRVTFHNYYEEVTIKGRVHYDLHTIGRVDPIPDTYKAINLVSIREDGAYEGPEHVAEMCRCAASVIEGLSGFHFHMLRHSYTSNLLQSGASPKDVSELLGHADISTTLNIYAHASRDTRRRSAHLLDEVNEIDKTY